MLLQQRFPHNRISLHLSSWFLSLKGRGSKEITQTSIHSEQLKNNMKRREQLYFLIILSLWELIQHYTLNKFLWSFPSPEDPDFAMLTLLVVHISYFMYQISHLLEKADQKEISEKTDIRTSRDLVPWNLPQVSATWADSAEETETSISLTWSRNADLSKLQQRLLTGEEQQNAPAFSPLTLMHPVASSNLEQPALVVLVEHFLFSSS